MTFGQDVQQQDAADAPPLGTAPRDAGQGAPRPQPCGMRRGGTGSLLHAGVGTLQPRLRRLVGTVNQHLDAEIRAMGAKS